MPTSLAYGKSLEELDLVLVHDNRGAQAILRSMMSTMRFARLRVYEKAEKALNEMMADPPNALISEWQMRPMSGHKLVKTIRNRLMDPLCFLPILAVTSMPTMSLLDRAFSVGVSNLLVMPISPTELRRRIEWLGHDSREFILHGESYSLDGIEEVLEERVRRTDISALLNRQKAARDNVATQAANAQDIVDQIVNGDTPPEELEAVKPTAARTLQDAASTRNPPSDQKPEKSKSTWNSWSMA